jgi:hypothetical protein
VSLRLYLPWRKTNSFFRESVSRVARLNVMSILFFLQNHFSYILAVPVWEQRLPLAASFLIWGSTDWLEGEQEPNLTFLHRDSPK